MANAVLHVICGNCGNGDPDMMGVRIYPGDGVDPPCAAISCKNCTTLHFLDGGRFRHQDHRQADQLRARIAELEAESVTAKRETDSLAMSIWQRHYREASPNFELCDSVSGVMTQIDNMTAGLFERIEELEAEHPSTAEAQARALDNLAAKLKAEANEVDVGRGHILTTIEIVEHEAKRIREEV